MPCYFCDGEADGDIEHVPSEVLYPDILRDPETNEVAGPDYKVATADDLKGAIALPSSRSNFGRIITVPSCEAHNRGLSVADEALAVNTLQVANVNNAGVQKKQWYFDQVRKDLKLPRDKQTKAQRIGMRLLRPDDLEVGADWDEGIRSGLAPSLSFSDERIAEIRAHHAEENALIDAAVRKISAGIYYAVAGRSLGRKRVEKLSVVCPDFKGWSEHKATSDDDYFKEHFAPPRPSADWHVVVSGNPQAFYARLMWDKKWGNRFALRFNVYGTVRFWITSDVGLTNRRRLHVTEVQPVSRRP